MKNHFFFSYTGNKRDEVETIHDAIKNNLKNITTIIEPFCGSSAFSFYIASLYPGRFNYVLNDNNKFLIELYLIAQSPQKFNSLVDKLQKLLNNINKERYIAIVKQDNLYSYIISHYIYAIRPGLFPNKGNIKQIDGFLNAPIIQFLRNESVKITNDDALQCYEKYKTSKNNFLFLDPPYVMLNNDFYANSTLNIYEYLHHHSIKKEKAFIILVLEWSWIIQLLFEDCKVITYDKTYQTTKKKTTHAIISNK
jgi:site-specific DNA-adenine methylase